MTWCQMDLDEQGIPSTLGTLLRHRWAKGWEKILISGVNNCIHEDPVMETYQLF